MHSGFDIRLSDEEINRISALGLAHVGDAVYELMVRSWLCVCGRSTGEGLHNAAISYVSAPAQAKAAEKLLPMLTEEEAAVIMAITSHQSGIPLNRLQFNSIKPADENAKETKKK